MWHLHYGNAHQMAPFLPVFLHFFYWNVPSGKKKAKKDDEVFTWLPRDTYPCSPTPQKCLHFNFYQKNNFCLLLISLTFQLGVMAYFEVFSILPNHLKISVAAKSGSRIPEFNGHNNSICRLLVASLFQKEIYTLMFNNLVFYVLHLVY